MQFLFDFFPLVFFFIAYKFFGIYVATGVLMAASATQVALQWLLYRRIEKAPLITLVLVIALGGATLFFHDPRFIKWKPTAIYWVFSMAFIGSHFIGKTLLIRRLMDDKFALPQLCWRQLNISWALFFVLLGALNLLVAYYFDTNVWVNFKLFGTLGLMLLFTLLQGVYISRHLKDTAFSQIAEKSTVTTPPVNTKTI